jgi:hypothetical protein
MVAVIDEEQAKQRDAALMATYPILEWFAYEHLPVPLQGASQPFHEMAWGYARRAWLRVDTRVGDYYTAIYEPELDAGLRKLLEAKDCIVRATKKLQRS